jgi:hypothetical protein
MTYTIQYSSIVRSSPNSNLHFYFHRHFNSTGAFHLIASSSPKFDEFLPDPLRSPFIFFPLNFSRGQSQGLCVLRFKPVAFAISNS